MLIGIIGALIISFGTDMNNLKWIPLFAGLFLISFQFVVFYALTKIYATNHGLIPRKKSYDKLFVYFTLERGVVLGFILTLIGMALYYFGFKDNMETTEKILKIIVPAVVVVVLGMQTILFSFFFSILGLKEEK
jgi:MFS family permease